MEPSTVARLTGILFNFSKLQLWLCSSPLNQMNMYILWQITMENIVRNVKNYTRCSVVYNMATSSTTFDLSSFFSLRKRVHCSGSFQLAFLIDFFPLVWDDLVEFIIQKKTTVFPASAKIDLTVLFHQSHMSCCMETGNWMNRTLGFSCHCRNTASVLHHVDVPLSPLPLRIPLFRGTACLYHCKVKAFLKNCWKIWWREGVESHAKTGFSFHFTSTSLQPIFDESFQVTKKIPKWHNNK